MGGDYKDWVLTCTLVPTFFHLFGNECSLFWVQAIVQRQLNGRQEGGGEQLLIRDILLRLGKKGVGVCVCGWGGSGGGVGGQAGRGKEGNGKGKEKEVERRGKRERQCSRGGREIVKGK